LRRERQRRQIKAGRSQPDDCRAPIGAADFCNKIDHERKSWNSVFARELVIEIEFP
jgi:hypothetical protein